MARFLIFLLSLVVLSRSVECSRSALKTFLQLPGQEETVEELGFGGTKWALLIAGSFGYGNYRHQADICHAYQVLKRNGLKDENIVVFMADDIAFNRENPRQGTIINKPDGQDVYAGVPKDYTGENVTVNNFLAALRGDASAIVGGSGKVVASGPDDHVFVYYSDHGGPGILGMPTLPFLFANDIVDALVSKHAAAGYRELVFYLEACESGSIFEGLLPENIDVYATTASNAWESSWGTYCPGMDPNVPMEYDTCLGDLYSVAWMEESEMVDLAKERLLDQYEIVKERTSNRGTFYLGSHVMQYGSIDLNEQPASHYLGRFNFAAEEAESSLSVGRSLDGGISAKGAVHQRDADLYHLWHKFQRAEEGSKLKKMALEEITRTTTERARIDRAVDLISDLVKAGSAVPLSTLVRSEGSPLVDDWNCLKSMVREFESKCGQLTQYGMKHTRTFADLCNAGISPEGMGEVADKACPEMSYGVFSGKFSA